MSLRDPDSDKYVGDTEGWNKAEEALRQAVRTLDVDYVEELGEAAFYGPKIDFVVKDADRTRVATGYRASRLQPPRTLRSFLCWVGQSKPSPRYDSSGSLRIHGTILRTFNRAFCWEFPHLVGALNKSESSMNDDLIVYADECLKTLKNLGIRAEVDDQSSKLGAKYAKRKPTRFLI